MYSFDTSTLEPFAGNSECPACTPLSITSNMRLTTFSSHPLSPIESPFRAFPAGLYSSVGLWAVLVRPPAPHIDPSPTRRSPGQLKDSLTSLYSHPFPFVQQSPQSVHRRGKGYQSSNVVFPSLGLKCTTPTPSIWNRHRGQLIPGLQPRFFLSRFLSFHNSSFTTTLPLDEAFLPSAEKPIAVINR